MAGKGKKKEEPEVVKAPRAKRGPTRKKHRGDILVIVLLATGEIYQRTFARPENAAHFATDAVRRGATRAHVYDAEQKFIHGAGPERGLPVWGGAKA
jgi:hypothetical protein